MRFLEHLAHLFVFFPFFELAFPGAVPFSFAFRASLLRWFTTGSAFWLVHKLIKNIRSVQIQKTLHLCLWIISICIKEVSHLIFCNSVPVTSSHYIFSHFWKLLNNEGILLSRPTVSHH